MNFYQYLNKNGLLHILDESPEKINKVRKAFRKEYKREYQKGYLKQRVHKTIIFSKEEYNHLLKASQNHKLGFSTFVRESSLKYLSNGFIIPDKEQTQKIQVLLVRYGTLLNQLCFVANASMSINPKQLEKIRMNFQALERDIKKLFIEPILIEDFIRDVIEKEPSYVNKIQTVLNKYK